MKKATCRNCGAVLPEGARKCPYCGTGDGRGSGEGFRAKLSSAIDRMLGLKDEAYDSLGRMVLFAFLRALGLVAVIAVLAFACSQFVDSGYREDTRYEQRVLAEIEWANENLDKLDAAYSAGDLEAVEALRRDNPQAASQWSHYSDFLLQTSFNDILEIDQVGSYELRDVLYFLYYPEYIVGRSNMPSVDEEGYEAMRRDVFAFMLQRGYAEDELAEIYRESADSYGYVTLDALDGYAKEGADG